MKKLAKSAIALFLAVICMPATVMAEPGNWGLGYGADGEKPSGQDTADDLLKNNAYYVDPGEEKVIYLTFDAGFENGYTEKILDVLKEAEVPAAFFLVGTYIRDQKDLVLRMEEEGHIVGNHSLNHPDMSQKDKESFTKELTDTEDIYKEVTGKEMPKFYRPPQGKYSEQSLQFANELGYTTVFWSLAYVDWNEGSQPTKEEAFSKLIPRVHPGAVILLHSTSETNANILKDLIEEYKEMGYEFKSLNELGKKA